MGRPMKEGTCRTTKTGQRYYKRGGVVKFVKKGGRSRSLSGAKRTGRKRGRKCIRRKRVRAASGGTVLRCAKFK